MHCSGCFLPDIWVETVGGKAILGIELVRLIHWPTSKMWAQTLAFAAKQLAINCEKINVLHTGNVGL